MQSERNKLAARVLFEAITTGDLDRLDAVMAPDIVDHDPYNPHASDGLEGVKRLIGMYREAFPDISYDVLTQVAEGDLVATRWVATGTHRGELMGAAPTGERSIFSGIAIQRFEGGKVVESWSNWDTLGMFLQLGVAERRA
jgi:predicted ester cyclase